MAVAAPGGVSNPHNSGVSSEFSGVSGVPMETLAALRAAVIARYPLKAGLNGGTFARACAATYHDTVSGTVLHYGNNVPRFTGNHLEVEEARTNLVAYSEDANNWGAAAGVTLISTTETAPDGSATATLLEFTSDSDAGIGPTIGAVSNATAHTVSVFLKGPAGLTATLGIVDGTTPAALGFKHVTMTGNWVRVEVTGTVVTPANFHYVFVGAFSDVPGHNIAIGDQLHYWGYQFEEGGRASSYIPTSGSAATRVAEHPTLPSSAIPHYDVDSSFAFDFYLYPNGLQSYHGTFDVGGNAYRQQVIDTDGGILTFIPANNAAYGVGVSHNRWHRLLFTFDASSGAFIIYLDGVQVYTSTAGVLTGTTQWLDLFYIPGYALDGRGKNFVSYNRIITADEAPYA